MHKETVRRIGETLDGEASGPYRDEITLPDGSRRVYESYFTPLRAGSSSELGLVQVVSYDISKQHQAETQARDQLVDLQLAHRIAGIGYWQFDPEIGVPVWSEAIFRIYERDPALGPPHVDSYRDIYAPDQYELFRTAFSRAVREGVPYDIILRLNLPGGRTKWVHALGEPQPPAGPAGYFIRGTIQDVTRWKEAE
jgi:PAS domain-containing protein